MLKVINPATGQLVRELETDTPELVAEKFQRAHLAQKIWACVPMEDRLKTIRNFRELVVQRTEELARILTSEVGKPISQSRSELKGLSGRIDFFLENTARVLDDETVLSDPAQKLEEKIAHEPLGVIGNISAWNYPYYVGSNVFVPALLAGNAVLYKPSEFAALTGLAIAGLLHEAGIPDDVFIPLIGGGEVGAELCRQPLAGIFFTGSYATGQKIAEAAAKRLMKVQLELGGKDPTYVREDADVNAAAESLADGAFYNCGQSCCSVERIYVHEKVYDAFVETFFKTVKTFVAGDPLDDKTYIGPVTRREHLEVLDGQVCDALKQGARLLCGGKRMTRPGYYFEPTVFVNVNHSMELMREETFGPMIGLQKVSGDAEAIRLMNDTAYGLTAGVYSKSRERATAILAEINSGSVYWNCCDRVSPRLPWSGRGHSGVGTTLSTYGIQTFVQ
ncbi:MAG: aldehyde dehydrogenase family protein, partial [Verrucomicrobiota bacterium]